MGKEFSYSPSGEKSFDFGCSKRVYVGDSFIAPYIRWRDKTTLSLPVS